MQLLPINYTISNPCNHTVPFWQSLSDPPPSDFTKSILTRDSHTCQFCGFKSGKYQQVIVERGEDCNLDAIKTACIYCAQCMTLEKTMTMGSAVLIWLPEITQSQINRLAKLLYLCRISQGLAAEKSRKLLDNIMKRRIVFRSKALILNKQGRGSDDPADLIFQMRQCKSAEDYTRLMSLIEGMRLFPLDRRKIKEADLEFNQFPQILAYWRSKDGPLHRSPQSINMSLLDPIIEHEFAQDNAMWLDEVLDKLFKS